CLGETSLLKNKTIVVNYSSWFSDIDYRREIADQIEIDFSDEGLHDISKSGRGSSFDGDKFSGKADKMDVMNRWKSYVDHPLYRELLHTDELLHYSNRLFGHIPGTEVLFA
ncbi:MAG: hypothetical protein WBA10_09820, partial [Elainellaceae cyanobacterium]